MSNGSNNGQNKVSYKDLLAMYQKYVDKAIEDLEKDIAEAVKSLKEIQQGLLGLAQLQVNFTNLESSLKKQNDSLNLHTKNHFTIWQIVIALVATGVVVLIGVGTIVRFLI